MDEANGGRGRKTAKGRTADRSTPTGDRRPPALVTSVVLGAIGAVLLVVGLLSGNEPLVLSAVACGTVSLVAVLVWREQLIAAWRRDRGQGQRR
ncbi:MAG TPA: hypothetical protein VM942_02910 [Acidimicrobiales bacterium]|nr:hypothetical protein [Acidimicrobiales bacterium]